MRHAAAGFVIALFVLAGCGLAAGAADPPAAPPAVTDIEFVSPHQIPEPLARRALHDLVGRPRSRPAIREGLARLWSLGLFAEAWAEEVPTAGGVRLRIHLLRRPFLGRVVWSGDPGLSTADLADAAGLGPGGDAAAARLEGARQRLLALYAREGYSAATVEIRSVADPASNGHDVTVMTQAGPGARVGSVTLQGDFTIPPERILGLIRLSPGDRYREAEVAERIRDAEEQLRKDGYLEAHLTLAPIRRDPASGEVPIEITVRDGPRYRVRIDGAEKIRESRLRDRLSLHESGIADDAEAEEAARQLRATYLEEGYAFAEVRGTLTREGEGGEFRFEVSEGPRVSVEAVGFSGNDRVSAEELAKGIQTRTPGFPFASGVFRREALDRDLRVIAALYHGRGFPDVRVGPVDLTFSEDRQRVRIAIPIVEGPRFVVGTVTLEGVHAVRAPQIRAALSLATGDPWSQERVATGERAVRRLYARRGYLNPGVTIESVRGDGVMHLTVRVEERQLTRLGRILTSGLSTTRAEVVERELPLQPGDPLDAEGLMLAERRLVRLGIFDRVEVAPLPTPPSAFADAEFRLKEGRPWRLDLGGGYSTDEHWRGFLEVGHDNLFGTGRGASARETISSDGRRTDLGYKEPYLFATYWDGDAALFEEYKKEDGYKRQEVGGAVGVQRLLLEAEAFGEAYRGDRIATDRTRGLTGQLRYRINQVRRYEVDPSLAAADVVPGSELVASLVPAFTLDLRDSQINPTRGSRHLLSVELGAPFFGSEINFVKTQVETSWYTSRLGPGTLVGAARIGLAAPLGDTEALAIEDRFKAGGSTTIRGYALDKVGPLDAAGNPMGGNARVLLNLEYRLPLWQWLGVAAFADTGTIARTVADLALRDFMTGVGGGLRLTTPVGTFRLDAGYALNRIPGEDRWQLYFDFGHAF
jgi:outer membrane protein insertion porin family